jgi:predicted nucleic acid-binding protein
MVRPVKIVCNSSPLIFLARLGFLNKVVLSSDSFYLPQFVADEIGTKQDEANALVKKLVKSHKLEVKNITLLSLVGKLIRRLGRGESEAIALAVELQADYVLLDDFAARKEAIRIGLNGKGTLAVIRKLQSQGEIRIENLEEFYQTLTKIKFRIKRKIFDEIFRE